MKHMGYGAASSEVMRRNSRLSIVNRTPTLPVLGCHRLPLSMNTKIRDCRAADVGRICELLSLLWPKLEVNTAEMRRCFECQ
jgi:hypothetical protein